jgi:hypothetical protein
MDASQLQRFDSFFEQRFHNAIANVIPFIVELLIHSSLLCPTRLRSFLGLHFRVDDRFQLSLEFLAHFASFDRFGSATRRGSWRAAA